MLIFLSDQAEYHLFHCLKHNFRNTVRIACCGLSNFIVGIHDSNNKNEVSKLDRLYLDDLISLLWVEYLINVLEYRSLYIPKTFLVIFEVCCCRLGEINRFFWIKNKLQ